MVLETERLILRPWTIDDAQDLYYYAKDPNVGPNAGWSPHSCLEESMYIINKVFCDDEIYAICLKDNNRPIGCIEIMTKQYSNLDIAEDEAEIGYWLGVPFWGRGIVSEAIKEINRRAFVDLGISTIWCGYFDGNERSKRCQEKCGYSFAYTLKDIYWKQLGVILTEHITKLTKEEWLKLNT